MFLDKFLSIDMTQYEKQESPNHCCCWYPLQKPPSTSKAGIGTSPWERVALCAHGHAQEHLRVTKLICVKLLGKAWNVTNWPKKMDFTHGFSWTDPVCPHLAVVVLWSASQSSQGSHEPRGRTLTGRVWGLSARSESKCQMIQNVGQIYIHLHWFRLIYDLYDIWEVRCWWGERTSSMLFTCKYESTALPVGESLCNHPGFLWPWSAWDSQQKDDKNMMVSSKKMRIIPATMIILQDIYLKYYQPRSPGAFLKAPNLTQAQRLKVTLPCPALLGSKWAPPTIRTSNNSENP